MEHGPKGHKDVIPPAFCGHLAQCLSSFVLRTLVGHFVSLESFSSNFGLLVEKAFWFFFFFFLFPVWLFLFLSFLVGCLAVRLAWFFEMVSYVAPMPQTDCLRVPIVIKCHDQNQPGDKRVYFSSRVQSLCNVEESHGRNSREELKQKLSKMAAYWLVPT